MRTDSALVALAVCAVALVSRPASACGMVDAPPLDVTFDGAILGVPGLEPLFYDPTTWGFHVPCGCELDEQKADWSKYLAGVIAWDDWKPVLSGASIADLDAIILALKSDKSPRPQAYANSALFAKRPAAEQRKLISALYLVGFARRVEPFAHFDVEGWEDEQAKLPPRPPDTEALPLQQAGETAMTHARDEFLRQRYAFLLTRLIFYRKDWKGTLAFFDGHARELAAPSVSLSYRARYYAAGAALRDGQKVRADLELARVYAGFPDLAALATNDFDAQDPSWQTALGQAKTAEEKTALWTMEGIRGEGVEALQEIAKISPDSALPELLAVRELERLEMWSTKAGAFAKFDAVLEPLAAQPVHGWLYALVRGHSAALQGDVPGARRWLQRAQQARPNDPRLSRQAAVSEVIALAHVTNLAHPQLGDELMRHLEALPAGPVSKYGADNAKVRAHVAELVGAAPLASWTPDRIKQSENSVLYAAVESDPDTLLAGFRLVGTAKTPFEKFLVADVHPDALAVITLQSLIDHGRFTEAASVAKAIPDPMQLAIQIPREASIRDCYQCDSDRNDSFNQKGLLQKLLALEKTANGGGARSAQAAFEIGRLLMHLTLLDIDNGYSAHPAAAVTWFARAYDTAKSRELKAQAAYFAARCEMLDGKSRLYPDADQPLPVPKTWFPRLAELSDTKFEKEVLAECGHFRRWREATAKH